MFTKQLLAAIELNTVWQWTW